jgi:hypothetical protein
VLADLTPTGSPGNIMSVMGYIVDFTIVMHKLSAVEGPMSMEHAVSVSDAYARSDEIKRVHGDIREFIKDTNGWRLGNRDYVLGEIISLIGDAITKANSRGQAAVHINRDVDPSEMLRTGSLRNPLDIVLASATSKYVL